MCVYGIGQVYSYNHNDPRSKVFETSESTVAEDDSYLGYSAVAGDFTNVGQEGVAVGMPRGGGLKGKVIIMSWDMQIQLNITGTQIGAYFGYALCGCDVNGDGRKDLIVGAPMYAEEHNSEGKYDVGRIHIFYQGTDVS